MRRTASRRTFRSDAIAHLLAGTELDPKLVARIPDRADSRRPRAGPRRDRLRPVASRQRAAAASRVFLARPRPLRSMCQWPPSPSLASTSIGWSRRSASPLRRSSVGERSDPAATTSPRQTRAPCWSSKASLENIVGMPSADVVGVEARRISSRRSPRSSRRGCLSRERPNPGERHTTPACRASAEETAPRRPRSTPTSPARWPYAAAIRKGTHSALSRRSRLTARRCDIASRRTRWTRTHGRRFDRLPASLGMPVLAAGDAAALRFALRVSRCRYAASAVGLPGGSRSPSGNQPGHLARPSAGLVSSHPV